MSREIGSEFHSVPFEDGQGINFPRCGTLVFSGRTAIAGILHQLSDVHTALLPSYCCDSMIAPFRDMGLDVNFYTVEWNNGLKIDVNKSADVYLWCNYFGYRNEIPKISGIIIEDITHSLLSEKQYHEESDFLVGSIRKWEPVNCGGYCSIDLEVERPSDEFVQNKMSAMEIKNEYLKDLDSTKKMQFLAMFEDSNRWLAEHYSDLSIDPWSKAFLSHVNVEKQRSVRRENARVLYEGLRGKVQFMFSEQEMDCPLFVPIILTNRDEVRAHLIKNEIYCPVHWPKPEGCESNIYDIELSLICDQRYGIEDMRRIVSVVLEAL